MLFSMVNIGVGVYLKYERKVMSTEKERIIGAIDRDADDETKGVAEGLAESACENLAKRIEYHISKAEGPKPITTILELRRGGKNLSYRLKFETQVWSGMELE